MGIDLGASLLRPINVTTKATVTPKNGKNIFVFSNPAIDILTISNVSDNSNITAVDMNGKVVAQLKTKNGLATFNVGRWSKGGYIFYIKSGNKTYTTKAIID